MIITKITKIKEVNNEMAHNYYFLVNTRMYNNEKTRYYKGKFIFMFDIFDLLEYYEKDRATAQDVREYARILAENYADMYDFNGDMYYNEKARQRFWEFCDNSIKSYNK